MDGLGQQTVGLTPLAVRLGTCYFLCLGSFIDKMKTNCQNQNKHYDKSQIVTGHKTGIGTLELWLLFLAALHSSQQISLKHIRSRSLDLSPTHSLLDYHLSQYSHVTLILFFLKLPSSYLTFLLLFLILMDYSYIISTSISSLQISPYPPP